MSAGAQMLHMLCGKMASGKSTLAQELARAPSTVLVSEDTWLNLLFADQMSEASDYVRFAAKLQQVMEPHILSLLEAGVSVVLDFPANTIESREWMRRIVAQTRVAHQLHVLDVTDAVCLERLQARNASGAHPFAPTEAQFRQFTRHFVLPVAEEGFTTVIHVVDGG